MLSLHKLPAKVNYLIGNDPSQWRRNVPTYAKVKYEQLYPGVDLVCYGNQRQLEYDFVLDPGANPDLISCRFEGVDRLEIGANGDLILCTPQGQIRQQKPLIYQTLKGARTEIAGGYFLKDHQTAGFWTGSHDGAQPLV